MNFNADEVRALINSFIQGGYSNLGEFLQGYNALNEFEKKVFVVYLYILKINEELQ